MESGRSGRMPFTIKVGLVVSWSSTYYIRASLNGEPLCSRQLRIDTSDWGVNFDALFGKLLQNSENICDW